MRLYNNIDSLCDSYSIPVTNNTIGYLQFFSEFVVPGATDVTTVKCFVIDAKTGVESSVTPLNIVVQYLDNNTFRLLIQGYNNLPELFKFRFKIEISTNSATVPKVNLFSDLFSFLKCEVSYPIIPCLVDTQQYSSYGAFLGEISGNIVYQSWHTGGKKKYTPVVFLRNVSFNKKTSTIEFKKLNNKPLKSTLKKNYNLICEPVSSTYSEYVMDIFGFGKVNILKNTFAFDTYSDEVIDEKDCCSLYKITATAYKETQLRLQCANNCVVLDPVDCSDLETDHIVNITVYQNQLQQGFQIDITTQIMDSTGFDISELGFVDGLQNDCWKLHYDGTHVYLVYGPVNPAGNCEDITITYEICGAMQTVTVHVIVDTTPCIVSVLNSMTYSSTTPIGWTILGTFNTAVTLQYTTDNINWTSVGNFPAGSSIFTNALPQNNFKIRVVSICDSSLISNVLIQEPSVNPNYNMIVDRNCDTPFPWVSGDTATCSGYNEFNFATILNVTSGFIRLKINGDNSVFGLQRVNNLPIIIDENVTVTEMFRENLYASCSGVSVCTPNIPPTTYVFEFSFDGINNWQQFNLNVL
ncbi:hypothetical protein [Chryseobacterium sp. EO14]|uniref:hypothetical protein n=1 Tax=Chryseobacterium sp. EO14 TaxID=2950551 RepID=UPI0021098023|nr:hypothetical protein [Chryseobacterium sp. EO14]MCQ4139228.1 hypothetical protein [Chryseobacterium sp. EO14]